MADARTDGITPRVRCGQPDVRLGRDAFDARFRERFVDPAFATRGDAVDALVEIAWRAYDEGRKAPVTQPAGAGFADPDYALSVDWLAARDRIAEADAQRCDPASPTRVLLVCGSPRSEHTCPGEASKTWRLLDAARGAIEAAGATVDVLELNRLASEYGRVIHPCKACVSTAMPLCHWPCSCYPNHGLGQTPDWMADIYARWSAAHGVLLLTPVHWNGVPSVLKLMMDRMVCADGGNPDPTSTQGKDAARAKRLELDGWDYPKHLAGRAFALVVHGDAEGVQGVRHQLADWLSTMGLVPAGAASQVDRYIGYYAPYATSHDALDREDALFEETRQAATALLAQVARLRAGERAPDAAVSPPREK